MCLQFGFVIFWQKDFGAKAAHKMLVKLTPGVNFKLWLKANGKKRKVDSKFFKAFLAHNKNFM
jgi:hypothetical protein